MAQREGTYQSRAGDLRVSVEPAYQPSQSHPERGLYVWSYNVEIANEGVETVQLLSRRWEITDAMGRVEIVEGDGVVGEQPVLQGGQSHAYTSGCPLPTPSGIMRGSYVMRRADGSLFEIEIPAFSLDLPNTTASLN